MASTLTTTTQVDPAVAVWYDKVLLERALPELVHDLFAQRRNLRQKSGNTIKFRRYSSLTVDTAPLPDNGANPALEALSKTDLLATIQFYGKVVGITDVVDYTVEDDVLNETGDLLSENMGQTLDTLTRDIMSATASYLACTGGGNAQTPTELSTTGIDAGVMALLTGNAKPITEIVRASTGVGTAPVRKAFYCIGHVDEFTALQACTAYIGVEQYPQRDQVHEAEYGAVHNTRWLLTTFGKIFSTTPNVYHNFMVAQNAYGVTEIDGTAVEHIFKPFGHGEDYLNRRATMGWKASYTARILNDAFLLILGATNKAAT